MSAAHVSTCRRTSSRSTPSASPHVYDASPGIRRALEREEARQPIEVTHDQDLKRRRRLFKRGEHSHDAGPVSRTRRRRSRRRRRRARPRRSRPARPRTIGRVFDLPRDRLLLVATPFCPVLAFGHGKAQRRDSTTPREIPRRNPLVVGFGCSAELE